MARLYNKALVIGATSGIGKGIADKLISEGTKVIATGRRRDRLEAFIAEHGADRASSVVFDITRLKEIPAFAKSVAEQNPDLDCIIINSGIQRPFNFAKPETIDLDQLDLETTTNYTSYVHLTVAFLPFLQQQQHKTSLIFISATLALIPGMLRTGNYNAVKGALHSWIMVLREQLKRAGQNIKVVEVFPPAVQTEIHDERFQPDLINGGEIGMPLDVYTDKMYAEFQAGEDQFAIGHGEHLMKDWEAERTKLFLAQIDMVDDVLKKYKKN